MDACSCVIPDSFKVSTYRDSITHYMPLLIVGGYTCEAVCKWTWILSLYRVCIHLIFYLGFWAAHPFFEKTIVVLMSSEFTM
ncbi:hypothetical protein M5689_014685 [Euphorbia peplus]|nr:hypothetical protein M5689_014685 [Euphorbia peplus]